MPTHPSALPHFKYHPDPLATGSVKPSDAQCMACEQQRGMIYTVGIYGPTSGLIVCPWCIADGSAHTKFKAEFVDLAGVGGDEWDAVSDAIAEEVAYRTPGFSSWQQEKWFTHCADAAAFLGCAGKDALEAFGPAATEAIRQECGLEGEDWQQYRDSLDKDHGPTAYVFRCLHCGEMGGYSDFG